MGKVIMSGVVPVLTAPVIPGLRLSEIAEGSLVKINENGSPVEFYVACHDYESALNGTGRTLLVRKDCYDKRQMHSSSTATTAGVYSSSDLDSWLNSAYKSLLDVEAQTSVGNTKFQSVIGRGNFTTITLERSVFILSITELGKNASWISVEGFALPIASILQIAYYNGSSVNQWARNADEYDENYAAYMQTDGSPGTDVPTQSYGVRPCFTLPATAVFDEETLILKGVA